VMGGEHADAIITDPPYGINLNTDYSQMPKTTRGFAPIEGDEHPFDASVLRDMFKDTGEQFWFGAEYYASSLGDTEHSGAWLVWDKRVDDKYDTGFGSAFELCWSAKKRKRELIRVMWFQNHASNEPEARNRLHPTQKPIDLIAILLEMSTKSGDYVIDPFLGSGTTLIACERLGRKCRAVEISPAYCAVAIQRWVDVTGKEPVLLSNST